MHERINEDDSNHPSAEKVECNPTVTKISVPHDYRLRVGLLYQGLV